MKKLAIIAILIIAIFLTGCAYKEIKAVTEEKYREAAEEEI